MPKLEIRPASRTDFAELRDLFHHLDALHRDQLSWRFQRAQEEPRDDEFFAELLANEDVAVLVAVEDDRVVGFVHGVVRSTPDFPIFISQRVCNLENIYVNRDHRNRGVGRALLSHLDAWSRLRSAAYTQLMVYEFNSPAKRFFEQSGYSLSARQMVKRS